MGASIARHLERLVKLKPQELRRARERKFAAMGGAYLTRGKIEEDPLN